MELAERPNIGQVHANIDFDHFLKNVQATDNVSDILSSIFPVGQRSTSLSSKWLKLAQRWASSLNPHFEHVTKIFKAECC